MKAQSRSSTLIAAYLIWKFKWSVLKTLEFLNSRRPGLEIRTSFIHQLSAYESILITKGIGPKTTTWDEVHDKGSVDSEEFLLTNTFLNSKMGKLAYYNTIAPGEFGKVSIQFREDGLAIIIKEDVYDASASTKSNQHLIPILKKQKRKETSRNSCMATQNSVSRKAIKTAVESKENNGKVKKVKLDRRNPPLKTINLLDININNTNCSTANNACASVSEPVKPVQLTHSSSNKSLNNKSQKIKQTIASVMKEYESKDSVPKRNSMNTMSSYRTGPIKYNIYIGSKECQSHLWPWRGQSQYLGIPITSGKKVVASKVHNRPSSPGLNGKVLKPVYTSTLASAMCINKKMYEPAVLLSKKTGNKLRSSSIKARKPDETRNISSAFSCKQK